MAAIKMHTGVILDSADFDSAEFWEKGSSSGQGFSTEASVPTPIDTLVVHMKDDPKDRYDPITGEHARRIAHDLDSAHVRVNFHRAPK